MCSQPPVGGAAPRSPASWTSTARPRFACSGPWRATLWTSATPGAARTASDRAYRSSPADRATPTRPLCVTADTDCCPLPRPGGGARAAALGETVTLDVLVGDD